jgi:hypothetical protein
MRRRSGGKGTRERQCGQKNGTALPRARARVQAASPGSAPSSGQLMLSPSPFQLKKKKKKKTRHLARSERIFEKERYPVS